MQRRAFSVLLYGMRRTLAALMLLFSAALSAQKFGGMEPNRFTYISAGAAYPYIGIKAGYEIFPNIFLEGQALTDGGAIWKQDEYNDWRSFSILANLPLAKFHSEIRSGIGLLHVQENLRLNAVNSFGFAPQIGFYQTLKNEWAIGSSITWPYGNATRLTPGILFSVEYRIGRYEKENGLH